MRSLCDASAFKIVDRQQTVLVSNMMLMLHSLISDTKLQFNVQVLYLRSSLVA